MNKASERQKRYDDKNIRRIGLKLNRTLDADIIEALEAADSMQGFIKDAVRFYIENGPGKENGED